MDFSKGKSFHYKGEPISEFPEVPNIQEYTTISFAQTSITSFKNFPVLSNLVVLILDNTLIENLMYVVPQPSLKKLYLRNTPFSKHTSQEIMCSIAFGPSLRYYNGFKIKDESITLANIMAKTVKSYLLQGWVIYCMNPIRMLNTITKDKKVLFTNDDGTPVNKKIKETFVPLEKIPSEACSEAFYDALDLTSKWNNIRKARYPKGKKKEKKMAVSFSMKPKSIAQCRSIVRDSSKTYEGMMYHISSVPSCKTSPFSKKKEKKVPRKRRYTKSKISDYSEEEEFKDMQVKVNKYKNKLANGVNIFSTNERVCADIMLDEQESEVTPKREGKKLKLISLADQLENSSKWNLLTPVVTDVEQDPVDMQNSTPSPPKREKTKESDDLLVITPIRKETSSEIFDIDLSDDELVDIAQMKFYETYPELMDDDDECDKFVDNYIKQYKLKKKQRKRSIK